MFESFRLRLASKKEISFSVRVHPGAKRTQTKRIMADGTLKIDLAAPPEDGKANAELISVLAGEFDVPQSHVTIVSGLTARKKVVRVRRRIGD